MTMLFDVFNNKIVEQGLLGGFLANLANGTYRIEKIKKRRTLDQNAYMHGLFGQFAKDSGTSPSYVKYIMKGFFLTVHEYKKPHTKDTHELNTQEIGEFIDNCLNFMAEQGYKYPTPEQWKGGKIFTD